jgi:hypothetical protein
MKILPITDTLSIRDHLRGVSLGSKPDGTNEIEMFAERITEMIPKAVESDENGKGNAVDYRRLIALLIEAVKEQQVQIQKQEHSLKEQKTQVSKLRGEIERLKISMRAATAR